MPQTAATIISYIGDFELKAKHARMCQTTIPNERCPCTRIVALGHIDDICYCVPLNEQSGKRVPSPETEIIMKYNVIHQSLVQNH